MPAGTLKDNPRVRRTARSAAGDPRPVVQALVDLYVYERDWVVAQQQLPSALDVFDALSRVFVEYATHEPLDVMPGRSYFLAPDETELHRRFRYELLPLLDEYLREGLLGRAAGELQAVRDGVEDMVQ